MKDHNLETAVCHRLHEAGIEPIRCDEGDNPGHRPAVIVQLPTVCYHCYPGMMQLVEQQVTPDADGDPPAYVRVEYPLFDPRSVFEGLTAETAWCNQIVLAIRRFPLFIAIGIDELHPLPRRHNNSPRWKRFPPSRRRRMKSWQWAPEHVKRRYAPLAGRRELPWWAQHPDRNRCQRRPLGVARVLQTMLVYAQPEADLDQLLKQRSHEWTRRLMRALLPRPGGGSSLF